MPSLYMVRLKKTQGLLKEMVKQNLRHSCMEQEQNYFNFYIMDTLPVSSAGFHSPVDTTSSTERQPTTRFLLISWHTSGAWLHRAFWSDTFLSPSAERSLLKFQVSHHLQSHDGNCTPWLFGTRLQRKNKYITLFPLYWPFLGSCFILKNGFSFNNICLFLLVHWHVLVSVMVSPKNKFKLCVTWLYLDELLHRGTQQCRELNTSPYARHSCRKATTG